MPLCWCSTPFRTVVHIVSGPEECGRPEERFESEAPGLAACYYEEWR